MTLAAARDVRLLLVTAPAEGAEGWVRTLVEERLAACGNVVPGVVSVFRWEGEVERAEEVLVVLKTRAERVPEAAERIVELHPYDVPEVLEVPLERGSRPYLEWVARSSAAEGTAAPDAPEG